MKVKTDFVSNSSSTSFIYISPTKFTKTMFFEAVGIEEESPLSPMFNDLFQALNDAIYNGEKITSKEALPIDKDYPSFSKEVLNKAIAALDDGHEVIVGHLSSDEELHESFLCVESFEIDSSEMILNAYENYW